MQTRLEVTGGAAERGCWRKRAAAGVNRPTPAGKDKEGGAAPPPAAHPATVRSRRHDVIS